MRILQYRKDEKKLASLREFDFIFFFCCFYYNFDFIKCAFDHKLALFIRKLGYVHISIFILGVGGVCYFNE